MHFDEYRSFNKDLEMVNNDNFMKRCIRDFFDEMDEFEKSAFNDFLSQNPQEKSNYDVLKTVWENANLALPIVDTDRLEKKPRTRIHSKTTTKVIPKFRQPKKRLISFKSTHSISVLSILLLSGLAVWVGENQINSPLISKYINSWQRTPLTLSDGNKVWLNGSSTFSFPERFSENDRIAFLEGEAFFEEMPDSLKSFLLESNELITKVMYTSSIVNSYKNKVLVEVRTGKVSIENAKSPVLKLEFLPNEKGIFVKEEGILSKAPIASPEKYIGWITNFMMLENETLQQVAKVLETRFEILFSDPAINRCQLSGKIKDNPPKGILDTISTLYLTCEVKGRTIAFNGKNFS